MPAADENRCLYRVWIARFENWRPERWSDVPSRAQAVEPAVPGCLTREEAAQFIAGFNEATLADWRPGNSAPGNSTLPDGPVEDAGRTSAFNLWAVAVLVVPRFEGDFAPGQSIEAPESPCERFS